MHDESHNEACDESHNESNDKALDWEALEGCRSWSESITNLHGRKWSSQLYATSGMISVTQLGPGTHIAMPVNPVIQLSHHFSK